MYRVLPVALGLVLVAWPSESFATGVVFGVGPAGSGCGHLSVGSAIAAAGPDDIVRIAPGVWPTNVTVDKNLTLEPGTSDCSAFDATATVTLDGNGARLLHVTSGAGVHVRSLRMEDGFALFGGIVFVDDGSLVLDDAVLADGQAVGNGGCVLLNDLTTLVTLGSSKITQCTSGGHGGAVFGDAVWIFLEETSTVSNSVAAADGGGVFIGSGDLRMYDSASVTGNSADRGGGLFAGKSSLVQALHDTSFTGNTAIDGGGLFVTGADVFLAATVADNEAGLSGGGMAIVGTTVTTHVAIFGDASFVSNDANDGGGIFADERTGATIVSLVDDVVIQENHADNVGGGIASTTAIDATGTRIVGNVARAHGGGVFLAEGTGSAFTNVRFEDNIAQDGNGGGLFVNADADAVLDDDSDLCDASALPADEFCSQVVGNDATDGGGVHVVGHLESNRTAYRMNTASGRGSALRVVSGGEALVGNARVTENTAASGGAVDTDGTLVLHHATVAKNDSHGVVFGSSGFGSIDRSILFAALGDELVLAAGVISLPVICSDVATISGAGTTSGPVPSFPPQFVTTARGGFHLDAASPAESACFAHGTALSATDQDQEPRTTNPLQPVDMGAFERP